jgi:MoaA/NifB/PqqE/SkfB family radical SAM enzyme
MLLYVDVIDACHLNCPTCVRGMRAFPNTSKKMSLEMFRNIINKAKGDGAYKVDIFSWIEPFLCRNLHEYVAVVKSAGLPCGLSSTLSIRNINEFDATIGAIDTLTISISGFEQEINEINHVGGTIEFVKRNLQRLDELKRSGATSVDATLRMLMFDYNCG